MYDTDFIEQHTAEAIELEITNLDPSDHAESNTACWFTSNLLAWQVLSPRRRSFRLASALGVLLLLVTLFSLNTGVFSHPRSVLHPPAVASLATPSLPRQDGIACLADAAWSPDSQSIAVLGYIQDCPQEEYVPGIVNLYTVHSRHVIKQLHPDAAIMRVLNGPLASQGRPFGPHSPVGRSDSPPLVLFYGHVLWSPDGERLALTFELALRQPLLHGVVVMQSDGTDAQMLLQYQSANAPLYAEWDTQRGKLATFSPSPAPTAFAPAPPALAYQWGTGGTLVPQTLLTDNQVPVAPQPGPIGNPGGGPSFSIWQPGLAHLISLGGSFRAYAWSTDFAAWSPSGRYLVDGLGLSGLLQSPGRLFPTYRAFVVSRMLQAPLLPAHDATFLQVIQDATAMAWSPDGRILAAYTARNIVDTYLDKMHGYAPLRTHEQQMHQYADLISYHTDPAEQFPLLRAFLPERTGAISPESVIAHNGLHYYDGLLAYWPGHNVILRRSLHSEAAAWVYLDGEPLCQAQAREMRRQDGSYRMHRSGG